MWHYVYSQGKPFRAGLYYEHKTERSWWSGRFREVHEVYRQAGWISSDHSWNGFMRGRPELHEAARTYLCEKAKQYATRTGNHATVDEYLQGSLGPVRLYLLPSMRLTLHGAEGVTVDGYVRKDCRAGETTVEFSYLTFRWNDRGNLHPGVSTETSEGEWIDDSQFLAVGLGKPFDILISWISANSLVKVCGDKCEFSGDWPPPDGPTGVPSSTRR